jgi:hypothetical protein
MPAATTFCIAAVFKETISAGLDAEERAELLEKVRVGNH